MLLDQTGTETSALDKPCLRRRRVSIFHAVCMNIITLTRMYENEVEKKR